MKIALIGTGNVGSTLGRRFAENGHDVIFGSREPQSDKVQSLLQSIGKRACADSAAEAAKAAEAAVLAVPWSAAEETARGIAGEMRGKVLIDATNPLGPGMSLVVGFNTSAGEQVAGWAPGARVVKAFNSIGAAIMANPKFGNDRAGLFYCGDDAAAKSVVAKLSEELGFQPIDVGPLKSARFLEPLCGIWLQLAYVQGMGPNVAFELLKR